MQAPLWLLVIYMHMQGAYIVGSVRHALFKVAYNIHNTLKSELDIRALERTFSCGSMGNNKSGPG